MIKAFFTLLLVPILAGAQANEKLLCEGVMVPTAVDVEVAKSILSSTPKLGDYALVEIERPGETAIRLIVDSNAKWLGQSIEAFAKKALAQINQNDVKAFLKSLATTNLANLLPKGFAYEAVNRAVHADGAVYYLEELMLSPHHKDLSLAVIGQILFENYAKKETRLVQADGRFALLINNKSAEVYSPLCESCSRPEALAVKVTPSMVSDKNQRSFSVIDVNGQGHTVKISGRTPTERMISTEGEEFRRAGPEDLVTVEFYFMSLFWPGGHSVIRVGDSVYNFGFDGWSASRGKEGVNGLLFTNPYTKNMFATYQNIGLPPFNIGMTFRMPKRAVQNVVNQIEAQVSLPAEAKEKFDLMQNNCNQVPLRLFANAGISIADPNGYAGSSSTVTFRDLFLNPPTSASGLNLYPMPGTELTNAQMRAIFPPFLYRHHTLENDQKFSMTPQ
jgi:hypothetical protein